MDNNNKENNMAKELEEIYAECSEPNWDGFGAIRVSKETMEAAKEFMLLLPNHYPFAEMGASPQGEVLFEWVVDDKLQFCFGIETNEKGKVISYAGIFGENEIHGTEVFSGKEIPEIILWCLNKFVKEGE